MTKITMLPVKSSSIAAVGYDPETQTLSVRFANGGTYHYDGVPPEKHTAMLADDSIGGYFHRMIQRAHPMRRIEDPA